MLSGTSCPHYILVRQQRKRITSFGQGSLHFVKIKQQQEDGLFAANKYQSEKIHVRVHKQCSPFSVCSRRPQSLLFNQSMAAPMQRVQTYNCLVCECRGDVLHFVFIYQRAVNFDDDIASETQVVPRCVLRNSEVAHISHRR